MIWRVLLTVLYTVACGAGMALWNSDREVGEVVLIAVLAAGLVVGFLVGRWWVLLAVCGALIGRTIGWDSGENDGNPALWWPYVMTTIMFYGGAPALGLLVSIGRGSREPASDSRSAGRTDA